MLNTQCDVYVRNDPLKNIREVLAEEKRITRMMLSDNDDDYKAELAYMLDVLDKSQPWYHHVGMITVGVLVCVITPLCYWLL